jgi:hypothetical protein
MPRALSVTLVPVWPVEAKLLIVLSGPAERKLLDIQKHPPV